MLAAFWFNYLSRQSHACIDCRSFTVKSFFPVDGKGAGFGNLEIIVNGGRVTSHVHTISKEQFQVK